MLLVLVHGNTIFGPLGRAACAPWVEACRRPFSRGHRRVAILRKNPPGTRRWTAARIKWNERSNRPANMFPLIVYAFMAHDPRRVLQCPTTTAAARRACLDDDGVLLRLSTVARPALIRRVGLPYRARRARCNHPVSPVRQRGPNSTRMPRASHPASTRPRSCCRSTAAAIA